SCIMVRLGPENTTKLISMRIESVTIPIFEELEEPYNFSVRFLVRGTFEVSFDLLSNLANSFRTARLVFDVALIFVIS
ncbi:hypothetical protein HID58_024725, partial [Brassica napus]